MTTLAHQEPQHLVALAQANAIRAARGRLKRCVRVGALSAADVIRHPPREVETMTVAELLGAQRRWGPTRCGRLLGSVGVSENRTVGALTERQRGVIAAELERAAGDA